MKTVQCILLFLLAANLLNAQQLRVFEQENKWGYKDASGNVTIPAQYDMYLLAFHSASYYMVLFTNVSEGKSLYTLVLHFSF